jgi:hypothetical protein
VAAFDRDVAQRSLHVRGHNVENAMSRLDRINFSPCRGTHVGGELVQRFTRTPLIELEFSS